MVLLYNIARSAWYKYCIITNAQGDITKLISGAGNVSVTYTYDAWGNFTYTDTSSTYAQIWSKMSLLYRGYVYDRETGLYYLQSRYYDPKTGRFINCDRAPIIGLNYSFLGWNGFLYCYNDPINYIDFSGYSSVKNDIAWKQLGFKYSKSKEDKRRRNNNKPPLSYSNWLKKGGKRKVNNIYKKKLDVYVRLISIEYIPKNKTNDYYLRMGGDTTVAESLANLAATIVGFRSGSIGYIVGIIGVMNDIKDLALTSDRASFKKEMNKGKGVAILEISIWSASFGGNSVFSYKAWDGKGDLHDFI